MSRRSESTRRTSPRLAEKRRLEQTDLHDTVGGRSPKRHSTIIPKTEDAEEVKEAEPTGDEAGPSQLIMDARAEPAPGVKRKRMLRKITPNTVLLMVRLAVVAVGQPWVVTSWFAAPESDG
ncbi:hypothetical protein LTR10_004610 [Elasticomyces elasticus]|nr:hypothetical protein LTR10_004610 [Elasticomyces elasticus]KAK4976928.1 hypothetical protein LTR42_002974 [Elasticomyces elasticus]